MSPGRSGMNQLRANRSLLKWIAVILFILAAIFLFFTNRVGVDTDLGLVAAGLAAWALS